MYVFSLVYWCPRRHTRIKADPRLTFSANVTGSRWSGFIHAGCRQRWSRTKPSGMAPRRTSNATRCANDMLFLFLMRPYPCRSRCNCQIQQPDAASITYDRKIRLRRPSSYLQFELSAGLLPCHRRKAPIYCGTNPVISGCRRVISPPVLLMARRLRLARRSRRQASGRPPPARGHGEAGCGNRAARPTAVPFRTSAQARLAGRH